MTLAASTKLKHSSSFQGKHHPSPVFIPSFLPCTTTGSSTRSQRTYLHCNKHSFVAFSVLYLRPDPHLCSASGTGAAEGAVSNFNHDPQDIIVY